MEHGFLDKYADLKSPIHSVDPRVKLVVLLTAAAAASFLPETADGINILYYLMASAAVLILLTRIPPLLYFKRALIILPPVTMLSLVYAFNDGFFNLNIFVFYTLKALTCFAFLFVLVGTTRFEKLLKALKFFRAPALVLSLLSFLYRYVFVIQDELERMLRAKELKLPEGSRKFDLKATFLLIGMIFFRSFERSERIYRSMLARSYDPEIAFAPEKLKLGAADYLFAFSGILYLWLILALQ